MGESWDVSSQLKNYFTAVVTVLGQGQVLCNGMSALDPSKGNIFTNDSELEKASHKEFREDIKGIIITFSSGPGFIEVTTKCNEEPRFWAISTACGQRR